MNHGNQVSRKTIGEFVRGAYRIIPRSFVAASLILCIGAARFPEPLSSRKEIRSAKPKLDYIDIRCLPLEDFPFLSKFSGLKRVRFYNLEGKSATDEKLKALADLNLTNLIYIDLTNCRLVTDTGIRALSKMRPLKHLMLEGAAITDDACDVMASQMSLTAVNIANCPDITKKGLEQLARSRTLDFFRFSSDKLTQEEVLAIVASFNSITWCEIVDTQRKLDPNAIKAKGAENRIHVNVRATGALQDMKLRP